MIKQIIPFITDTEFLEAVSKIDLELALELKPYFDKAPLKKRLIEVCSPIEVFDKIDGLPPIFSLKYKDRNAIRKQLQDSFREKYSIDEISDNQEIVYANREENKGLLIDNINLISQDLKIMITKSLTNTLGFKIYVKDLTIDKDGHLTFKTFDFADSVVPKMFQEATIENFGSNIDDKSVSFSIKYKMTSEDGSNNWIDLGHIIIDNNYLKIVYSQSKTNGNHHSNMTKNINSVSENRNKKRRPNN